MEVHKLISSRKSIRAFSPKKIDDEKLLSILEAARWAPSSMNEQPWRFIVARREDTRAFEKMLDIMNETNRSWAKNSSVILLTVANKRFSAVDAENDYAMHDVGLAVSNLSLQAMSLDIYTHQVGGFNREKAKELLNIPDEFYPVSMIVMGYSGDINSLPEKLQEREMKPRTRKPLSELVFINNFGVRDHLFTGRVAS